MSAPFWIERPSGFARVNARAAFSLIGVRMKSFAAIAIVDRMRDGFHVETLSVEALDAHADALRALAERALEPNVFYAPGFALPLARHAVAKARPYFVAVWRDGAAPKLVGLFPLAPQHFGGLGLARGWLDKQATLGTPLLDPECAGPALRAFFAHLRRTGRVSAIVLPRLADGGPLHRALTRFAHESGRRVATLAAFERAALYAGSDVDALARRGASHHALKEIRRRRRRMEEMGAVEFALLSEPRDVRAAVEQFLALEAAGWKGARGALLKDPALAAFVRCATRLMARAGKCKIARLTLDGRPIAMGIVLESQDHAYFWKIAFDESQRNLAPGIDLVHELSRRLAARADIVLTDSCAIANHPMIDRFWPDRIAIRDVAVEVDPTRPSAFRRACAIEAMRLHLRGVAKRTVNRLLRRKTS
jgi:CelD/BcsL family acetyltransferase involved in cellulose biosynthesis